MTLELGDVIARIGGDGGGGGPVPSRHVYDLGDMPISTDGSSWFQVPDVPEGATLVATLEWAGPETGGLNVGMMHGDDSALWVTFGPGADFLPITLVSTASGSSEDGLLIFVATAEGFTATSLTVIIIPHIEDTH